MEPGIHDIELKMERGREQLAELRRLRRDIEAKEHRVLKMIEQAREKRSGMLVSKGRPF